MNRREICLAATVAALSPRMGLGAGDSRADLAELSLSQASQAVRTRTVTSRDLTMACLSRIDSQDSKLNALITVMRDRALAQSAVLDAALRAESNGDSLFSIENTAVFNGLGLPAISIPCGASVEGLPTGLMICGPRLSEGRLLALAATYERATHKSRREP